MEWVNVSCDNSKHIIDVQRFLFNKYTPFQPRYIRLGNNPIENWGKMVASMLPNEDYIIFGLDDFLPIDRIDMTKLYEALKIMQDNELERFELGYGASKKDGFIDFGNYLEYGETTPYKVSTQFSIWKVEALKRELNKCTTPWKFEINGFVKAGCFKEPVFRWIEESAISGRQQGKINLCGLSQEDELELVDLQLLDKSKVIYGWKGNNKRTKESYGSKYKEYYD